MSKKILHGFAVILIVLCFAKYGNTMGKEVVLQLAKVMRSVCQPRFKLPDEKVVNIRTGDFREEHDVMCYIKCVFEVGQILKNGKVNYDAAVKQMKVLLSDPMKSGMIKAMTECREVPDQYADPCEGAFYVAKCMYNVDAENFFFA